MAGKARDIFLAAFKTLYASGDYSDLVMVCGKDTYNVHKSVVCTRSGFLAGAERFNANQICNNGRVHLTEDDSTVVKLLVQYLYEGEYDPKLPDNESSHGTTHIEPKGSLFHYRFPHTCEENCPDMNHYVCPHHVCLQSTCEEKCVAFVCGICSPGHLLPTGDSSQLLLHAKMYEIAGKYDVIGLKDLACEKFFRASAKYWDTERFASAARYVFSTTPEEDKGLRDLISKVVSEHMDLLNKPAVETLLTEFNGLAVALLKMHVKGKGWDKAI